MFILKRIIVIFVICFWICQIGKPDAVKNWSKKPQHKNIADVQSQLKNTANDLKKLSEQCSNLAILASGLLNISYDLKDLKVWTVDYSQLSTKNLDNSEKDKQKTEWSWSLNQLNLKLRLFFQFIGVIVTARYAITLLRVFRQKWNRLLRKAILDISFDYLVDINFQRDA